MEIANINNKSNQLLQVIEQLIEQMCRRHNTLLTVEFILRTEQYALLTQVPQGRHLTR
jgi:hypothetical protein